MLDYKSKIQLLDKEKVYSLLQIAKICKLSSEEEILRFGLFLLEEKLLDYKIIVKYFDKENKTNISFECKKINQIPNKIYSIIQNKWVIVFPENIFILYYKI